MSEKASQPIFENYKQTETATLALCVNFIHFFETGWHQQIFLEKHQFSVVKISCTISVGSNDTTALAVA